MIRVSIIEDNRHLSAAWAFLIKEEPAFELGVVSQRVEDLLSSKPNEVGRVLLLDLQLPGMDGDVALPQLVTNFPDLAIIVITVDEAEERITHSLSRGAVGYLSKSTSPTALASAITSAAAGGSPLSPSIARKIVTRFFGEKPTAEELSRIEQDILKMMARGSTYQEIADHVCLSVDGVRYHIRKIYAKLQVKSKSAAVYEALQRSLIEPSQAGFPPRS